MGIISTLNVLIGLNVNLVQNTTGNEWLVTDFNWVEIIRILVGAEPMESSFDEELHACPTLL